MPISRVFLKARRRRRTRLPAIREPGGTVAGFIATARGFAADRETRAFYAKHGFRIAGRVSDNQERLPHPMLEWHNRESAGGRIPASRPIACTTAAIEARYRKRHEDTQNYHGLPETMSSKFDYSITMQTDREERPWQSRS